MSDTKAPHDSTDGLLDRTGHLQGLASDPCASAWVSANAGSGKTYVLSRRVIRLLLQGADPSKILCLTFTKAAAAEMTRRVFDLLAEWTECDDGTLMKQLSELDGVAPDADLMVRARKLFARALETPGGLKIQTIHAFCEALLQRFPIEANVPGHFQVLDDRDQADLLARAKTRVFASAETHDDQAVRDGFAILLEECTDHAIDKILGEIIAERHALGAWIQSVGGLVEAIQDLNLIYDLSSGDSLEQLDEETVNSPYFSILYVQKCISVLNDGGKTDRDVAARMSVFLAPNVPLDKAQNWVNIFLTKTGTWRSTRTLISKASKARLADFTDKAEQEIARLETLLDRRRALAAVRLTYAFLAIGTAVLKEYDRQKSSRGYLDFEDLIVNSLTLLSTAEAALWVQYKLDQGIDHILVDEAQDTSPRQWHIVRALAAEFFSGDSGHDRPRTLFAVGDEKQSIYSFQGAEPKYFADMRRHFLQRARDAEQTFHEIALRLSFRSTPDVLGAVDLVFADPETAEGLTGDLDFDGGAADPIQHDAVRFSDPGDVTVWPIFSDAPSPEPEDWSKPIDVETPQSAKVRLAERIASQIGDWLERRDRLPGTGAVISAGDILVLVRKRDAFVPALVRALKARAIPVAGSDRLVLTDHIAVKDLIALGQVMVLREDDLSLAALLKSPLFNWSEEDLFAVAAGRDTTLWRGLEARAEDGHAPSTKALAILRDWLGSADFERPFEFYSRILDKDGGRRNFKARFGGEVDDVIDQFMRLALDSETLQIPSLDRFLMDLQTSEIVIKRELDAARSDIRIMTVHGAKGLEAPIVFLVDPGSAPRHAGHDPAIMALERGNGPPALTVCQTAEGKPALVTRRLEDDRRAGEQEYRRLLYVALTRARDRLIVCGYQGSRGAHARCWHRLVWKGLAAAAEPVDFDGEENAMLVWRKTPEKPTTGENDSETELTEPHYVPLPDWAYRRAEAIPIVQRLSPSDAIDTLDADEPGPKSPPRDLLADALAEESPALRRGRLVHRLLEILPDIADADRPDIANRAARMALPDIGSSQRQALVASILALLRDDRFAALFSTRGRAEVSLSGIVAKSTGDRFLVSGQIDRLLITDDTITLVDYKTNRTPPRSIGEAPGQYIAQLALYRRLLADIYPNHVIEAALLWTSGPDLMPIPTSQLDEALRGIIDC